MKVYQIILNETGVEPIPSRPGSYRVVYPPEYNMPPEGPLSKYEAEKKLQDAEIKFRNKKAQDYLDQKEQEKADKNKTKTNKTKTSSPEQPSTRKSQPPPPLPHDLGEQTGRKPDWWDKLTPKYKTAEYDKYVQTKVPLWTGRITWVFKILLRSVNLLEPLYMLYSDLARHEKAFMDEDFPYNAYAQARAKGEDPDRSHTDEIDKETYNNARNLIYGEWISKYGVFLFVHALARLLSNVIWANRAKNLFLYLGAPATFGATLVGAVGTEVTIAALIAYLESPEGKEFWKKLTLETTLFVPINGETAVTTLGDATTGMMQGVKWAVKSIARAPNPTETASQRIAAERAKVRKPDEPLPDLDQENTSSSEKDSKGQGTQNNIPGERPPKKNNKLLQYPPKSQSKVQWPSDLRSWVNGGWNIYGIPVTDGAGFLIPGIEYEARVRLARRWAKEHDYPDPLADLPAAPGEKHPGPFVD